MRRQPQQHRSRQMVEQIISAGFRSLARHGFDGTTTRHVAELAGISPGTLYHYFTDKEAIYEAMYCRLIDELGALLESMGPEIIGRSLREALHHMLHRLMVWFSANDGIYLRAISVNPKFYGRSRMTVVEQSLRELMVGFVMHNPSMMPLLARPRFVYVLQACVLAGTLRHLDRPGMDIGFEAFASEVVNMVCVLIDAELATSNG